MSLTTREIPSQVSCQDGQPRNRHLIGMQAALHQDLCMTVANKFYGFCGGTMTARSVDDLKLAEIET